MRHLLTALLLAASATAQTVRVSNLSSHSWHGWVRTTLTTPPPYSAGWTVSSFDVVWVVGEQVNEGEWPLDIRLSLLPGQVRDVALPPMAPVTRPLPRLPLEPVAGWGGMPKLNDSYFHWSDFSVDGAGVRWKCHASHQVWHATMEFVWYPETQGFLEAVVRIRAADFAHPALQYSLATPLVLSWGTHSELLLPQGHAQAHGDTVEIAATPTWPSLMRTTEEASSAMAIRTRSVFAQQL